jgi:hypothetical protein
MVASLHLCGGLTSVCGGLTSVRTQSSLLRCTRPTLRNSDAQCSCRRSIRRASRQLASVSPATGPLSRQERLSIFAGLSVCPRAATRCFGRGFSGKSVNREQGCRSAACVVGQQHAAPSMLGRFCRGPRSGRGCRRPAFIVAGRGILRFMPCQMPMAALRRAGVSGSSRMRTPAALATALAMAAAVGPCADSPVPRKG